MRTGISGGAGRAEGLAKEELTTRCAAHGGVWLTGDRS